MLLHLLLLWLPLTCRASHFFGTVMTYHPRTTNDGSLSVTIRYKMGFHTCTGSDTWDCQSGNCGTLIGTDLHVIFNGSRWCQREGIMTRQLSTSDPFELWFDGSDWINNIVNGVRGWRASTLIELRTRSDTGQANRSPQTTILPVVRVPSNCPRDLHLLAFDPDGDKVKCRYGNDTSECKVCTRPSGLNLSFPCILHFDSANSLQEGPYAVQLVVEDFPQNNISLLQSGRRVANVTSTNAISKLPLQFVLEVVPAAPSCTEGVYLPRFLHPTPHNGDEIFTHVSPTGISINIHAVANISTVSELLFSGPTGIKLKKSQAGNFTLAWSPSKDDQGQSQPICFIARATLRTETYDSELRCVVVTVVGPSGVLVSLRMKVSSEFPLSESDAKVVIQQFKEELVRRGLPPYTSVRLVRRQDAATAPPAGRP